MELCEARKSIRDARVERHVGDVTPMRYTFMRCTLKTLYNFQTITDTPTTITDLAIHPLLKT